jgi:hypothetical protein
MKQPNTKKHWTALSIAAYYQKNGHACRARDLFPMVTAIHDDGDSLISSLHSLKADEIVGHVTVETGDNGASGRVFAYYPTTITIEDLRDIGLPTELPDHSPIPDEFDLTLPTERVSAEEEKAGDIPLPTEDSPALEYARRPNQSKVRENPREYSTEDRFESDAEKLDFDHADDEVEDEDEDEDGYYCEQCGAGPFDSGKALGGHKSTHSYNEARADSDSTSEDDTPDVAHDIGYMAARTVEPPKPEWNWWDIHNRLSEKADEASDAGLHTLSTVYTNFASLAMERDFNEDSEVETEAEAILTKELVLMLLGAHHSEIDPDVIEDQLLERAVESRQAHEAME